MTDSPRGAQAMRARQEELFAQECETIAGARGPPLSYPLVALS
jgi:hypothetical protein